MIKKSMKQFIFGQWRKLSQQKTRGFTLVELIVSMALFIVVVFIVTSAFLTTINVYKKGMTTRSAMDNLNIVMESMARDIRTGTWYRSCDPNIDANVYSANDLVSQGYGTSPSGPGINLVPKDCTTGADHIVFLSSDGDVMLYRLDDIRPPGTRAIRKARVSGLSTNNITTVPDIYIDSLKFYVIGADNTSGTTNQPRVNIVVRGTAGTDPKTQTKFNIYTSVTQRSPK